MFCTLIVPVAQVCVPIRYGFLLVTQVMLALALLVPPNSQVAVPFSTLILQE